MPKPFVQWQDVRKTINGQEIIRDLNLQIPKGQIVALCGDNRAGKSTILRMIAGILQPSGGGSRQEDFAGRTTVGVMRS